jgi:uncharacterized protein GlcG (DUF336 family)
MAENLEPSAKAGKRRTKQTNVLTQGQAVEILQQAVLNCQQCGVQIDITTLDYQGAPAVMVVLAKCRLVDGNFVLAKGG